jgi:hypothetical protein
MRDQLMSDDKENLSPNIPRKSDKKGLQNNFSKSKESSGLVTPLKVSLPCSLTSSLTHVLKTVRQYDISQEEVFLRKAQTPVFKVQEDAISENKYMISCPLTPNLLSYQPVRHSILPIQLDKPINPIPHDNTSIILDDSLILDASLDNSEDDEDANEFNNILNLFGDENLLEMDKTSVITDCAHAKQQHLVPLLDKLSTLSEVRSSKRVIHIVTLYAIIVLKVTMIFIICSMYSIVSIKKASLQVARIDSSTTSANTDYYIGHTPCKQLALLDTLHVVNDPLIAPIVPIVPIIPLDVPTIPFVVPIAAPKLLIPSQNDKLTLLIPNIIQNTNNHIVLKNYQQDYALSTYVTTLQPIVSAQPLQVLQHESNDNSLQEVILLVDNTPSKHHIYLFQNKLENHVQLEEPQPHVDSAPTAITTFIQFQEIIEYQLDNFNVDKIQALEYVLIFVGIITFTV